MVNLADVLKVRRRGTVYSINNYSKWVGLVNQGLSNDLILKEIWDSVYLTLKHEGLIEDTRISKVYAYVQKLAGLLKRSDLNEGVYIQIDLDDIYLVDSSVITSGFVKVKELYDEVTHKGLPVTLYRAKERDVEMNPYDTGYTIAPHEESQPVVDDLTAIFNKLNGSIYTGKRFITRKNGDKMVQSLVYNKIDSLLTLVNKAETAILNGEEVSNDVIEGINLWEGTKSYRLEGKYEFTTGEYKEGYKNFEWEITGLLSSFNTGVDDSSFSHVGWLGGDEDQYYTPHIYNLRGGRKTSNVSFLTCLYVDIDGVTPEEAEQRLSKSDLPKPTLAVATGGGVHYYWFFNRPAQANGDEYCFIKTWRRLATHFTNQLQGDPQCVDIARLLRIPGTINTKRGVKSEVLYFNHEVSYSIMALHKQYNVTQAPKTQVKQVEDTKPVATKPKQVKAMDRKRDYEEEPDNTTGYNLQVKDDLLTLVQLRNGDTEGYRHTLLFYYKRFGATLSDLETMNNLFVKPVSENDVLAVSKSKGLAGKRPMRATIMSTLNINHTESSQLKQLVPADVVSSRRALRKLSLGYSKTFNAYKNYLNALYSQSSSKKTNKEKALFLGITARQVQSLKKKQLNKHKQVKRDLVASLDELIEVAVDVIEVINMSVLKEEELQSYLSEIITINNSLSALNQVLIDGEEYHDGKVRIRAVESKIKQIQAMVA